MMDANRCEDSIAEGAASSSSSMENSAPQDPLIEEYEDSLPPLYQDASSPQMTGIDLGDLEQIDMNPLYESVKDSEPPRHDVEENMRWEVTHLYNFFKKLYDDEHRHVSYLENLMSEKETQISSLEQALKASESQRPSIEELLIKSDRPATNTEDGMTIEYKTKTSRDLRPLLRSTPPPARSFPREFSEHWSQSKWCWLWCLVIILFMMLLLWMLILLIQGGGSDAPTFVYGPQAVDVRGQSFDISVALSSVGWVDYLVLATGSVRNEEIEKLSPEDVEWREILNGDSQLQNRAAACGTAYLPVSEENYTVTISTGTQVNEAECAFLEGTAILGNAESRLRCHRCPRVEGMTNYTILMVGRSEDGELTALGRTEVLTLDVQYPQFSNLPSVSGVTENALDLTLELDEVGSVEYWIQYSSMFYVNYDGVALPHGMMPPDTEDMNAVGAADFRGGIVANGTIEIPTAKQPLTVTIQPSCVGSLCAYFRYALMPFTSYQVHLRATDSIGNAQPSPVHLTFATLPDTVPPELTEESGPQRVTATSFDLELQSDELGGVYFVILNTEMEQDGNASSPSALRRELLSDRAKSREQSHRSLLQELDPRGADIVNTCPTSNTCSLSFEEVWSGYFNTSNSDAIVQNGCLPVTNLTDNQLIQLGRNLQNDTLYRVYVMTEDEWRPEPNRSPTPFEFLVRTTDQRAPIFTGGTPIVAAVDYTSFNLNFQMNEKGVIFYAITELGETPPTQGEVFAGARQETNGRKLTAADGFVSAGNVTITAPFADHIITIENVEPATTYQVFAIGEDASSPPNRMQTLMNITARTRDNIPPVFVKIEMANVNGTQAELVLQLDEASNVAFVILETQDFTSCPSVDQMFGDPSSSMGAIVASGTIGVASGFQDTVHMFSTLVSETGYTVCLAAEDLEQFGNRQTYTNTTSFTTLDVTPPQLQASVVANSIKADRFDLQISLNETGVVRYILFHANGTTVSVPSPQEVLDGIADVTLDVLQSGNLTIGDQGIDTNVTNTLSGLANETTYTLFIAAKDRADIPNYALPTLALNVTTPDVTPPEFVGGTPVVSVLNETEVTFALQLDEPGIVHYMVQLDGSAPPIIADLMDHGSDPGNSGTAVAHGNITVATGYTNVSLVVSDGINPLTTYKIFLVGEDDTVPLSNVQAKLSVLTFTTPDTSPPEFATFSVTYLNPSVYRVEAVLNEIGRIFFVGDKDNATVPTADHVFREEWGDGLAPEINGIIDVQAPNVRFTSGGCGIDANDIYNFYVVAEDDESPPNTYSVPFYRILNTSSTDLEALNCSNGLSLETARPQISVDSASVGFIMGPSGPEQNVTLFSQRFTGLNNAVPGSTGYVSVTLANSSLPDAGSPTDTAKLQFVVQRLRPAHARLIARTKMLYSEDNESEGRVLSLKYQLWDQYMHSQIDTSNLEMKLILQYLGTPPRGNPSRIDVGDCVPSGISSDTGIGECTFTLAEAFFPETGGGFVDADVHVEATAGGVVTATSATASVQLHGKPECPILSSIGMRVKMPYRPLYPDEDFVVSVEAASGSTTLDQFFVPIYYNQAILEYRSFSWDSRWKTPTPTNVPSQGFLGLNNGGQVGGLSSTNYQGSSVPLVTVVFKVKTTVAAGTYGTIVEVGSQDNPVVLTSISSGGAAVNINNPLGEVCDERGGFFSAAQITVRNNDARGIYAYSEMSEIFNTAVLDGNAILSRIQGMEVKSWYRTVDTDISGGAACSLVDITTDALSVNQDGSGCVVRVDDTKTEGGDSIGVKVAYQGQETEVSHRVWMPLGVRVLAHDPILNKLTIPAPLPGTCTRALYQSAKLIALADFGGQGLDTIQNSDVTHLVTFSADDPTALEVTGSMVQGLAAKDDVLVRIAGSAMANSTSISISDTEVCVTGLEAIAVSGVEISVDGALSIDPYQQLVVESNIVQDLHEEGSVAHLAAFAIFSDGSEMDVTSETVFQSSRTDYIEVHNRTNSDDPATAVVTAQMGDPEVCDRLISASWEICGVIVLAGSIPIRVNLPNAQSISQFTATPGRITTRAPLDSAASSPITIATSSDLNVVILFDDGVERDLSDDDRVVFTVVGGNDKCEVANSGPGTVSYVQTVSGSASPGQCVVELTIPHFGNPSLTERVAVEVVVVENLNLHLLHYDVQTVSGDLSSVTAPSYGPDTLRKLACGTSNYQQVTAWLVARLSDGEYHHVSQESTFETDDASTVALVRNIHDASLRNRLRPRKAGTVLLTGRFSFVSQSISVSVDDTSPATISGLAISGAWCDGGSSVQCQDTFAATRLSEKTLQGQITLDDGFVFSEPLLGAGNAFLDIIAIDEVLTFTSDVASAISPNALGDVTLLDNHHEIITLTASTNSGCSGGNPALTSSAQVYANLEPELLDVDLGVQYGIQFQKQDASTPATPVLLSIGDAFTMDVVVNSETAILQAFQITVTFDDAIMLVEGEDDCAVGADWPDPKTFACAVNLPGLTHQAVVNAQDTATTASSLTNSRVQVATITFRIVGSGQGTVQAFITGTRQSDGTLQTNYAGVASKGVISVPTSSGRKMLLRSARNPTAVRPRLNTQTQDAGLFRRDLLQSCDLATHEQVYGDINFDCKFEFVTDAVVMSEIFGEWNPDLPDDFPQRYYDALASNSVQNVGGQPSDWQRQQLDPLLRFYSRLEASDTYYLERLDQTVVPDLPTLTGGQIPSRPGFKDDGRLLQLIAAGLNFFIEGVTVSTPNETVPILKLSLVLRDVDSQPVSQGALALVQFEIKSLQNFTYVNPSANPIAKSSGTVLATADFEGNGEFAVSMTGSSDCNRFIEEDVEVGFVVLAKNNEGQAIRSSFFPFYGSTEKENYDPEPDENAKTYKDRFVPYTIVTIADVDTPAFLPGFPKVQSIHEVGFLVLVQMTNPAQIYYLVAESEQIFHAENGTAKVTFTPEDLKAGTFPVAVTPLASGKFEGSMRFPSEADSTPDDETKVWQNVTSLNSAGNYTLVMAAENAKGVLSSEVTYVVGILTPDTSPPDFANITLVETATDEMAGTFTLKLQVAMDEPGTVYFAIYRNHSCIEGDPATSVVMQGGSLPSDICSCSGTGECDAVATGSFQAGETPSEAVITGNLSPLPFESLRDASSADLHCFQGGIGQVSDSLRIYFTAEDALPNYKDYASACGDPVSSENVDASSCIRQGVVQCDQGNAGVADTANVQVLGMREWNYTTGSPVGGDSLTSGAAIYMSLDSPDPPQFLLLDFPTASRNATSFTMRFQTDLQGLVVFSVANMTTDIDALLNGGQGVSITEIGNGRFPVFDPSQVYNVTVVACEPNALVGGEKYVVVVVARDKYGRAQGSAYKELVETPLGR